LVAIGPAPSIVETDVTIIESPDYTITDYLWAIYSIPVGADVTILSPTTVNTQIRINTYVLGRYVFSLTLNGTVKDLLLNDVPGPPVQNKMVVTVPKARAPLITTGRKQVVYSA